MLEDKVNRLWTEGKPVLHWRLSIGNPFTAEIMAAQGYDAISIDLQYGALDYSSLLPIFQATRASSVARGACVLWLDPGNITKVLDAGAMFVICPMINTADRAAEFVSYVHYPPVGQRSFGPTRVGFVMSGYGPTMNDQVVALAMIETAERVGNLEKIAATLGFNGIYVGSADLTLGTQDGRLPPGFDREEPEMVEPIQRIVRVYRGNEIQACLHCGTPEYAAKSIAWGHSLTTVAADAWLLAAAAGASVARFREITRSSASAGGSEAAF